MLASRSWEEERLEYAMAVDDGQPSGEGSAEAVRSETSVTQPPAQRQKIHDQLQTFVQSTSPTQRNASPVSSPIPGRKEFKAWPPANKSGDCEKSSERRQGIKGSRDPLARYYSHANSFPDYGAPKHSEAMSSSFGRLKQINSKLGPVNTLKGNKVDLGDDAVDPPPTKRPRHSLSGPPTATYALLNKSPRNLQPQSAIRDAPQLDVLEIRSNSSAGTTKPILNVVQEYRNAQPRIGTRRTRTRVSRLTKSPASKSQKGSSAVKADAGSSPIAIRHGNLETELSDRDDPDILSSLDPQLAEKASDVTLSWRKTKRDRPSHFVDLAESQIKRQKSAALEDTIEVSEDELHQVRDAQKAKEREIPLDDIPILQRKRRQKFGEDTPSINAHDSPQKHGLKNTKGKGIRVAQAVCSKETYESNDQCRISLYYHPEEGARFEVRNEVTGAKEKTFEWLGFENSQIKFVRGSSKSPRHIFVHRSQSKQAGPRLYLRLESSEDVEALWKVLENWNINKRTTPMDDDVIERGMINCWNEAINYAKSTNSRAARKDEDGQVEPPKSVSQDPFLDRQKDSSGTEKIKDKLLKSSMDVEPRPYVTETPPLQRQHGHETRRSARLYSGSAQQQPSLESWTDMHPEWEKDWPRSLVFPATGRNRATVDKDDIPRLNEGEFLNDNLINFYLRWLQWRLEEEHPELLNKVYIFSTFFFEKLRSGKGKINYEGVKSWTAKVDLLSYEYIIVPVNEHAHWYLAIICNAPTSVSGSKEEPSPPTETKEPPESLDVTGPPSISPIQRSMSNVSLQDEELIKKQLGVSESPVKEPSPHASSPTSKKKSTSTSSKSDLSQPKVITLDSLGSPHAPTCRALKDYLIEEAKNKKGMELVIPLAGMTAKEIPEQDNFCDCGVYVLGYMREFLKDPDGAARKLLQKEDVGWDIRPSQLRNEMRTLLFDLQRKQRDRLRGEGERRRSLRQVAGGEEDPQSPAAAPFELPPHPPTPSPHIPGAFPTSSPKRKTAVSQEVVIPSSEATLEEVSLIEMKETNTQREEPRRGGHNEKREMSEEPQEVEIVKASEAVTSASGSNSEINGNGRAFYSASSSPTRKLKTHRGRLVVELKAGGDLEDTERGGPIQVGDTPEPSLVRESETKLVHGPSDGERKKERKKQKEAAFKSVEEPGRHELRSSQVVRSIEEEDEPRRKPKYDGIDRSVDLTLI